MNVKETYIIAKNNMKGRKRTGSLLFVIFFLAMYIYLLINSMVYSIDNLVEFIRGIPSARTLLYFDLDEDMRAELEEMCEDMNHVTEMYEFVYPIPVVAEGMDEKREMEIKSYAECYEKYIVEGEAPKENEIILPQYIYRDGTDDYVEGSQYIGRTLTLSVNNYYDEVSAITCKVSGTYDNIYTTLGNGTGLLCAEDAVKLYELSEEGIEAELERLMEDNPAGVYVGFEKQYHYGVVIDSVDNMDEVRENIRKELDGGGRQECESEENEYQKIFSYVQFIGMIITVILLMIVIIMMVVMIGNDIRGRKKEMAMYMVQGYTKRNLLSILSVEYGMRLIPVLFAGIIATLLTLMFENIGIDELLGMEYQVLNMELSIEALLMSVVILIIVMCMAVYTISEQIKKIELLKEIKSEG